MSPITTNLDDAIVEDGDYVVTVTTAEQKVSSSGNDMIELKYGIVAGKHSGKPLPIYADYLVFSSGAMPRVAHALKAMGVAQSGTFSLEASTLVGRKVLVTLTTVHEKAKDGYEARDVQKVTNYQPAPASAADNAVDAAMGGGTHVAAQNTLDDDSIPFKFRDTFSVDHL